MKIILLLLFSLAFLLLFTLASSTNNIPNQAFRTIRDTKGNPLNKNSRYFIVSAIRGAGGGGVRLANLGNQGQNDCPTSVVQSRNDLDNGIAVYITPHDTKYDIISEMSTVNIKFYLDSPTCSHFTMWMVDDFPKPVDQLYTISTGEQLIDSVNLNNRFQIKSLGGSTYKLVFCPYGEKFTCQNVGIADENGYNRLVLTENEKAFVFKKDERIGMAIV
ncbi:21 kDa seed protein-like [Solanum stenotomum]|uniref:21 kDa seed protein-like n=1 Tax=Solanum stenotomum TaxID=172797 RepID=UPI0020D1339D|nr:21 kDa seed protein-like [Solanum stenotomum]